jgi:hypothetical protein
MADQVMPKHHCASYRVVKGTALGISSPSAWPMRPAATRKAAQPRPADAASTAKAPKPGATTSQPPSAEAMSQPIPAMVILAPITVPRASRESAEHPPERRPTHRVAGVVDQAQTDQDREARRAEEQRKSQQAPADHRDGNQVNWAVLALEPIAQPTSELILEDVTQRSQRQRPEQELRWRIVGQTQIGREEDHNARIADPLQSDRSQQSHYARVAE